MEANKNSTTNKDILIHTEKVEVDFDKVIELDELEKSTTKTENKRTEKPYTTATTTTTTSTTEAKKDDVIQEEPKETTKSPEQTMTTNVNKTDSGEINLGEFKLTAYCSCIECCGKWALNRPVDENGNEIVYGATGARLVSGTSIAVDPEVIPYGSKVIINGNTYIAHDTGEAIKGNKIDVYHDNHEDALAFGVKHAEVFLVNN